MTDPREALTGTLALLAATAAILFAVALTVDDDTPAPPLAQAGEAEAAAVLGPEALLELAIRRTPTVARRVAAIRELEFKRVPKPRVSSVERLRDLAERKLAKPKAQRKLEAAEATLRLLGLLEADRSLDEVAGDVTALVVAYYVPRKDRLFLVGDAAPAGAELAEFVLAHELTHALEDQRFGLRQPPSLSDDRALAETALIEGTATTLMGEYAGRHLNPLGLAAEAAQLDAGAAGDLPRFAEAQVEFAYLGGADFVEALLGIGDSWKLIDFAYLRRKPATTEQILHPQKYLSDERTLPVGAPPSPGAGWDEIEAGTLGEFATREILREGIDEPDAEAAAAGWGGDRYRAFVRSGAPECVDECRSTHALGLRWRGDDRAEARELATGLGDYVASALEGESQGERSWQLSGGWAAVALAGDVAGFGLAPDRATAERLAKAVE